MCTHTGPFGGLLVCDRTTSHDEEADTGHTYGSTTGSDLDAEPGATS